jgi:hypothetical protein
MVGSLLFVLLAPQPATAYFPPPIPLPQDLRDQLQREQRSRPTASGGGHLLYINFDGATLTHGSSCSDATTGCTFIAMVSPYNFPAYGGTADEKQQILNRLTTYFADFDVQIVTTRPTTNTYSMTMVGPGSGILGGAGGGQAAGVAPLDCNDLDPNDISFAFTDVVGDADTYAIAVIIAQESAHGYGLGHTRNMQDIMYPMLNHMELGFANSTSPIYDIGGLSSDCTGTGQQNSYQLLMQNVGAGGPDMTPPTISFATPHDGDTVPSMLHIAFDASDNRGLEKVQLYIDGALVNTAGGAPWTFDIVGGTYSAGMHRLKGVATDTAGNVADSGEITVNMQALGANPGELGSACNSNADCPQGGFCAFDSGAIRHFCTRPCDMMANTCPMGFDCVNAGGPMVCAPSTGMGGQSSGGCDVTDAAQHDSPLAGMLLLGLGAFAVMLARARRN